MITFVRRIGVWRRLAIAVALCLAGSVSCVPLPYEENLLPADVKPPLLLGADMLGKDLVAVRFDEVVRAADQEFSASEDLVIAEVLSEESDLLIRFLNPPGPGDPFSLEGAVEDDHGNTNRFIVDLHGHNDNPARLLLNELVIQGSGNNPDLVELVVTEGGSLGGMVVYEGTKSTHDSSFVFPDIEVNEGDFILLHYKPEGDEAEADEIDDITASAGKNASDDARDFWIPDGDGLTGTNGAISVYTSRSGSVQDAVIYSNRTRESDENYRGFGSRKVLAQVDELGAAHAWLGAGELLFPEDAVWSDNSTATRSLNRDRDRADSDTALDWYTTATRGATPGSPNSRERYAP